MVWSTSGCEDAHEQREAGAPELPVRVAFDDGRLEDLYRHRTDMGNATWFASVMAGEVLYDHTRQSFLIWNGKRWERDRTGRVVELAKRALRHAQELVRYHPSTPVYNAMTKHLLASESLKRIQAMLELSKPAMYALTEHFDRDPWLLNVENGAIDLRTGELRPHHRHDLCSRVAPVMFAPDASAPRWERFLREVFAEDTDLIDFIQRLVGYTLTGLTSEQCLMLLYGTGANGKSTFINALRNVFGDYAMHAAMSTFLTKKTDGPGNEIAALVGARLVTAVEADDGRRLSEALVKQLTGGDAVTARFLFQEFFTFVPTFKLWLAVNYLPPVRGSDNAIWRRIRVIPFSRTFSEADQDRELAARLREESAGILMWAVSGCLAWQSVGLGSPAAVVASTDAYRSEMDVVGAFMRERCQICAGATIAKAALYDAFVCWCSTSNEQPLSKKDFGARVARLGFMEDRTKSARSWRGIIVHNIADDG